MTTTLIVTNPIYQRHQTLGIKEIPRRHRAINLAIRDLGLQILNPREATEEELLLCHTKQYIETVKREVVGADGSRQLSTDGYGDTRLASDSYKVALYAAGGVLNAVEAVINQKARTIFCNIRPPGHHASQDKGMGFCIFNNVAIAARYAQRFPGIDRVLIVDWDVHHGNGTEKIFYDDPSVFYFGIHQEKDKDGELFYPETGEGSSNETTLNVPIQCGERARLDILQAFQTQLVSAMERFKPNLVLISCGFDAREGDSIGQLNLTDADYAAMTKIVKQIADKYAGGRLVSALEGGYNLQGIASAARSHVKALE